MKTGRGSGGNYPHFERFTMANYRAIRYQAPGKNATSLDPHMYLIATFMLYFAAVTSRCDAQSVVIDSGNDLYLKNFAGNSIPVNSIPSDMSPAMRATELKLAMPTPPNWRNEMPVTALVDLLNTAGIFASLHESAVDNNLDPDRRIRLGLHNASREDNLRFMLDSFQCDFSIDISGRVTIASEDFLVENPISVTFDITSIPADPDGIIELIEETVDPDSWEANGGIGRMRFLKTGQRCLLTITTTWRNMTRVRRLMESVHGMSGPGDISWSALHGGLSGGSTILELPEHLKPPHTRYSGEYRNRGGGGFGGSGAGLGGGVF